MIRTILMGTVTKGPQKHTTQAGSAFYTIKVSCKTFGKYPERVDVQMWGDRWESEVGNFVEGAFVLVEGSPRATAFISNKTQKALANLSVSATSVEVIDPAGKLTQQHHDSTNAAAPVPSAKGPADDEDDVPF